MLLAWLRKYWGFLTALIGVVVGALLVRRRTLPAPDNTVEKKAEADATQAEAQDKRVLDQTVQQAEEKEKKDVQDIITTEQDRARKLQDDPAGINDFLHRVGSDVRNNKT